MVGIEVTVTAIDALTPEIKRFTLKRSDGKSFDSWVAGAHIDIELAGDIVNSYSLCSSPDVLEEVSIAVLNEPEGKGGSTFLHSKVCTGDALTVRSISDNFGFTPDAPAYLFVAGGIGITPILPMIEHALHAGVKWKLIYLGRSLSTLAFTDTLTTYQEQAVIHPSDTLGRAELTALLSEYFVGLEGAEIYACGPQRMLDEVEQWARARSLTRSLHIEKFHASATQPDSSENSPFVVELADGTQIDVPQEESILEALIKNNVPVLNSCREGVCGTCETVVLEGTPDHRDELLSDDEKASGETMMICVSRCKGDRLVLDI